MGVKDHNDASRSHKIIDLAYPTEADRLAGINETHGEAMDAALVLRGAIQLDTSTLWVLINHDPITWREI